jgi:DNA-3-methyladenine glycosylase
LKLKRPEKNDRLPRSFYDRPTKIVARELLGKALIRQVAGEWLGGRIVETEAYLPENDLACHASRGITASNASMFASPGTLYVYPIHAKHCLNVVTEAKGRGGAVLIRAVEPIWGIDAMKAIRGYDDPRRLTRGPGMLCQALQIDRRFDGIHLIGGQEIVIADCQSQDSFEIITTPRIGISKAKHAMLRYVVAGNRFVSRKIH